MDFLKTKKENEELLKSKILNREKQHCTFKPEVNLNPIENKSKSKKRNFNQFLNDQQQFETKKLNRINNYKEDVENLVSKDLLFVPQIDKISKQLISQTRKENENKSIHNRLYEDSKKSDIVSAILKPK